MPHIPTFERSVTTQPLRLARGSTAVPQGAFGQGSAAALQQVGQLVGQRAIEHLRKDALRQADAAFNSASAQAAAVQTAWQNRIGVNALAGEDATGVSRQGVYEEAVGALAEIGRQHGAELRGPARTLFNTKWVPHAGTVSNAASRYESKNRRAANVETHNASLDAEHRISRQSWDDDTALLQSQDRAMATIATNPFGKSPEALGEDVQAWLVQRNKDVATVMLNVEVNKDPAALIAPMRPSLASVTAVPVPVHEHHPPSAFGPAVPGTRDVPAAVAALPDDGLPVLIAGSLYLAGEVLRLNGETPT